jgi:hypothetical protein
MVRTVVVVRPLHAASGREGDRDVGNADYTVHLFGLVHFPFLVLIRLVVVMPAPLHGRRSEGATVPFRRGLACKGNGSEVVSGTTWRAFRKIERLLRRL